MCSAKLWAAYNTPAVFHSRFLRLSPNKALTNKFLPQASFSEEPVLRQSDDNHSCSQKEYSRGDRALVVGIWRFKDHGSGMVGSRDGYRPVRASMKCRSYPLLGKWKWELLSRKIDVSSAEKGR